MYLPGSVAGSPVLESSLLELSVLRREEENSQTTEEREYERKRETVREVEVTKETRLPRRQGYLRDWSG